MKHIYAMLAAFLVLLTLSGCQISAPLETVPTTQSTGESKQKAPDFVVYNKDGKEVRLSDFRGKPVVLNFWASWCGPCKMEMPDFNEAYQEMGQDIHFVIVNLTDGKAETVETASAYISSQGYSFPVYFDTAGNAAVTYGITSIPTTFFINSEGELVAYASGALSKAGLQEGISLIA